MTNGQIVGLVAVTGAAGYLLFVRRDPVTGRTLGDALLSTGGAPSALDQRGPGNVNYEGASAPASPGTRAMGIIGAGVATAGALVPVVTGAGAAAGTAAAATGGGAATAAATGIGTAATVGITAGIGGAVLLTWAVWKKGLFRGGAEALYVNPDRDQFLSQFGETGHDVPWEQTGAAKLAAMLTEITGQPNGSSYWTALMQADTVREFEDATRAIQSILQARGIIVQAP